MQRRAKVGAVEREHSRLRQLDVERFRLARVHHHVDVLFDDAEAVNHVPGLFDISDVHREIVAHLGVDPVRSETTADCRQLSHNLIAVSRHAGIFLVPNRVRIFVFRFRIDLSRLDFANLENLRKVRLGFGVGLSDHFHFVAADVDQLARLRLHGSDIDVAACRQLVHCDQPFAVWIFRVAARHDEVAGAEMRRDLIENGLVQIFFLLIGPGRQLPFRDVRIDEHRRVSEAFAVVLRVQRAEPDRHFAFHHRFVFQDRYSRGHRPQMFCC